MVGRSSIIGRPLVRKLWALVMNRAVLVEKDRIKPSRLVWSNMALISWKCVWYDFEYTTFSFNCRTCIFAVTAYWTFENQKMCIVWWSGPRQQDHTMRPLFLLWERQERQMQPSYRAKAQSPWTNTVRRLTRERIFLIYGEMDIPRKLEVSAWGTLSAVAFAVICESLDKISNRTNFIFTGTRYWSTNTTYVTSKLTNL